MGASAAPPGSAGGAVAAVAGGAAPTSDHRGRLHPSRSAPSASRPAAGASPVEPVAQPPQPADFGGAGPTGSAGDGEGDGAGTSVLVLATSLISGTSWRTSEASSTP